MTWNDLFLQVWSMSLAASVVIAAVLTVRLLLKKAPKLFSYLLWAAVLFRLLCPVSISSDLSLFRVFPAPIAESIGAGEIVRTEASTEEPAVPSADETGGSSLLSNAAPETVLSFLPCFWGSGAVLLMLRSAVQFIRLRRRLVGAVPLRENIYFADHIDSPFVMGVFRPKIYLPSGLSQKEQAYIILHEQQHIRRCDYLIRAAAFIALCLHWFNPLVWLAFVLSGKDMEMSCDEAVMRKTGEDIRAEYSASLLRFAVGRRITGMPLAFGEGDTKGRVKNIMNYKKVKTPMVIAAAVICLFCGICFLTDPSGGVSAANSLISRELLPYRGITYQAFRAKTSTDAEFYHANFYSAPIPGTEVNIVFAAKGFDEQQGTAVLEKDDKAIRLEGTLGTLIPGVNEKMTVDALLAKLTPDGQESPEYRFADGAGTAYYIADRYLAITFDSDGDQSKDSVLEVVLDPSGQVSPDSRMWLVCKSTG